MHKVTFKALMIALLVFAVAALAGPTETKLIGTWTQEGSQGATWTFRSDGSGFMEQTNPRTTARFTWTCQGVKLQLLSGNLVVPYTVVSSSDNELVLKNNNSLRTYRLQRKT